VENFQIKLKYYLGLFNIDNPHNELKYINTTNENKKIKNLREQFPGKFNRLMTAKLEVINFLEISNVLYPYIYKVRCNLFHGSKTRIQLLDGTQKLRLLIYTELHIITSDMLFVATEGIGWKKVKVEKV